MSVSERIRGEVIDSRDVIEALNGLWDEEAAETGTVDPDVQALSELHEWGKENAPDWQYGEVLIREDYFTDYIKELIEDCYIMPWQSSPRTWEKREEIDMSAWPYRHLTMDYEAAAEEAKADYSEVTFNGHTYLVRSV